MRADADQYSPFSKMLATGQTQRQSYRLIAWTPFGIALGLIVSMMPEREVWLYAAAVLGALASLAVGRTSGTAEELPVQARLWRFVKSWLLVVAFAALSILHGKWQPMVFFALVGGMSSALFRWGCKTSK